VNQASKLIGWRFFRIKLGRNDVREFGVKKERKIYLEEF
jgi:hypothetical protein